MGKGKGDAPSLHRNAAIKTIYNDVYHKKGRKPISRGSEKSGAAATFSGDLMSELKEQSPFFKKVESQAQELGPRLQALTPIIDKWELCAVSHGAVDDLVEPNMRDVLDFVEELEETLGSLEDEVQVLKICCPDWPAAKVAVLRELA